MEMHADWELKRLCVPTPLPREKVPQLHDNSTPTLEHPRASILVVRRRNTDHRPLRSGVQDALINNRSMRG
jgi:hypothetical protein